MELPGWTDAQNGIGGAKMLPNERSVKLKTQPQKLCRRKSRERTLGKIHRRAVSCGTTSSGAKGCLGKEAPSQEW